VLLEDAGDADAGGGPAIDTPPRAPVNRTALGGSRSDALQHAARAFQAHAVRAVEARNDLGWGALRILRPEGLHTRVDVLVTQVAERMIEPESAGHALQGVSLPV
jgi:hypothetical protein